jgi:hypothetical protein
MAVRDLKKQVRDTWQDMPAVDICLKIIDFLASKPVSQLQMLTFSDLARVGGDGTVDQDLLTAISILTSSSVAALDTRAVLCGDDNEQFELSLEDLAQARSDGFIVHPGDGSEIFDFERTVIPFFVPSRNFIKEAYGPR